LVVAQAAVIGVMLGYYFWTPEKTPAACKTHPACETPGTCERHPARHGLITGIVWAEEKPSVVIDGEIVYEGDTIHGVKVVKTHRDKVEFEKDKTRWTQQMGEQPTRPWPEKGY